MERTHCEQSSHQIYHSYFIYCRLWHDACRYASAGISYGPVCWCVLVCVCVCYSVNT